LSFPRRRESSP